MKMAKYLQTNEQGYVVSITDEPLLIGLFGGNKRSQYRPLSDEIAEQVREVISAKHQLGEGLHIKEIDGLLKKTQ